MFIALPQFKIHQFIDIGVGSRYSDVNMLGFVLIPISPVIGFICMITVPLSIFLFKIFVAFHVALGNSPSVDDEFAARHHHTAPALEQSHELPGRGYQAICTSDSIESNQLKFEMIRAAKRSIVLSGCYCGGKVFNDALDLIYWRLEHCPKLTAEILSSTIWLEPRNYEKLDELKRAFPDRFHITTTREKNLYASSASNWSKISSNHVKSIVIDYGRYFMIGGSALQDRWTNDTGDKHLPAVDLPFYSTLTQESMAPRAFRDCDFLVFSPEGSSVGRRLYFEMMKLITRWQYYNQQEDVAIDHIPRVIPELDTVVPSFQERPDIIDNLKVALFVSGPEFEQRSFMYKMIDHIDNAKEQIYINHLYFHPPQELLESLINASNRGVKIKILTNPVTVTSPGLHFLFAALSKNYLQQLYEGQEKSNVEIYQFHRDRVTLHKKIVIVDGSVLLTGSSNFGYTSMTGAADYEFDLIVESPAFAKHTLAKNCIDEKMCRKERVEVKGLMKLLVPFQACLEFLL